MARARQFGLVLCCVLSLFASSVSACWCAGVSVSQKNHCSPQIAHEEKAEHRSGVHSSDKTSENVHHKSAPETSQFSFQESDECCCVQSAPKVYAKSEGAKIEKQSVLLTAFASAEVKIVRLTKEIENGIFSMPFYLSDSFYNLTPGRAPPVL